MFDWLFEGRTNVYIVLAVVAIVLLYLSWQRQQRPLLIAAGIVIALLGVYFLLDYFVETDREQVQRHLLEIADAVKNDKPEQILSHLSSRFSVQGMDKAAFKGYLEPRLRQRWINELVLWEFAFPVGEPPAEEGTMFVTFSARPKNDRKEQLPWFRCEATFARDPDRQWRMLGFQFYDAVSGSRTPIQLP